jgi:hypothetical protein
MRFILVFLFLLCSCSFKGYEFTARVEKGMTQEQVKEIFHKSPDSFVINGNSGYIWTYYPHASFGKPMPLWGRRVLYFDLNGILKNDVLYWYGN